MSKTRHSWFVISAAGTLLVAGLAKLWSAFAPVKVLAAADPIVGIPFGHLLVLVGLVELVIAGICLLGERRSLSLGLIAWLATTFLFYRFALWWVGWRKPCGCLGSITDALHIPPKLADNIMKIILIYLLIGSYAALLRIWRHERARIQSHIGRARAADQMAL